MSWLEEYTNAAQSEGNARLGLSIYWPPFCAQMDDSGHLIPNCERVFPIFAIRLSRVLTLSMQQSVPPRMIRFLMPFGYSNKSNRELQLTGPADS